MDAALASPSPGRAGPPDLTALCSRYLAALLAGDRRRALQIVIEEGAQRGYSVRELQCGVVQQAQHEIGRLWQQNEISIAQEHMATAISQVVLARLFEEAAPAERIGKRVMVACVEGELHDFPARLVADFLDLGGFDVRHLGANVPTDDLMKMLAAEMPDLLALSVTMSFNAPALLAAVRRVRTIYPRLPILVGGHALAWEPRLASDCGVVTCEPDPECVLDAARRLLAEHRA
jgi:methanogenic corrinoid protein MtbC1